MGVLVPVIALPAVADAFRVHRHEPGNTATVVPPPLRPFRGPLSASGADALVRGGRRAVGTCGGGARRNHRNGGGGLLRPRRLTHQRPVRDAKVRQRV
ncbi:hypothetical protein DCW30_27510 [Streptomyces alfalfae]|uniref:Secreted protein n=1 Tax=Streptomyces alfalfae TaxID=1642299 RepID=A0ABM6GPU2_9ACTN|nr:hypothetical protein A7J05_09450 [Streptomyces alfalfae]AYA16272.1 hypothetical protein D3X13_08590 [Streptomyces fradiae]RXX38257.1 hypothetical protein DCW30_27510 [Streptomyces alfalfae]RZN00963.1 hypothetical protein D4104_08135 [Streptomyces alfalfae]